jgi:hypothetical protein
MLKKKQHLQIHDVTTAKVCMKQEENMKDLVGKSEKVC